MMWDLRANSRKLMAYIVGSLFLSGSALQLNAAVNDVLPADFFPLQPGASTFAVYAYERQSDDIYAQGRQVLAGRLDTQILALRLGHFFSVGGQPLSVIGVLPWARTEVSPAPLTTMFGQPVDGLGDIRLGATFWPLTDRENGHYLGVSALISLPTGEYARHQVMTIGENRYKTTLSLGWIRPLSQSLVLELTPELAWYGDNREYLGTNRLSQRHSVALTAYLRYRATPSWQFHIGWQENRGGETQVNGIDQNNAPDNTRWMLGSTFTSEDRKNQWIARLAADAKIENGFRTDREILIRYLRMF